MSGVNDNLILNSIISPVTCKIGDSVTYMIQITVPQGIIAYNIQLNIEYPYELQEVIENTFSLNGAYLSYKPTITNGKIIFQNINIVDGSDEEVIIVYSFKAKILDAHLPKNPILNVYSESVGQEISNIYVDWSNNDKVFLNKTVTGAATVYIQLPYLNLEYEQKNVTEKEDFTKYEINFNIGDTIAYRIILINSGQSEATNIIIKDRLLTIFKIEPSSFKLDIGTYQFNNSKNEFIWNVPSLGMGEVTSFTFTVQVLPNISLIQNSKNYVEGQYTIPPVRTKQFVSNSLILNNNGASFSVKSNSNSVAAGSEFQYIITIKFFKGTEVTDLKVYDILPLNEQYIDGLTIQINSNKATSIEPILSIDSNNQQIVEMPQLTEWGSPGYVKATENMNIIYIFNVRENTMESQYPYYEKKINNVYMTWQAESYSGMKTNKTSTSCNLEVTIPNLSLLKEQFVDGDINGSYSENEVFVRAGDIVNYKLIISSGGGSPSFNIVIKNILQPCFLFNSNILVPAEGQVSVPSVGNTGIIQLTIPKMEPGQVLVYEYSLKVKDNVPLDEEYISNFTANYYSNFQSSSKFTVTSNQLLVITSGLNVNYFCDRSVMHFGKIAKYTIKITIPKGITVYDLKIDCLLTQGYQYVKGSWSSTMSILAVPTISSEGILQYSEPNTVLNAQNAELNIIYTYQIKLNSFIFSSPYTQLQDNVCNVSWLNSKSSHVINTSIANCLVRINGSNINCVKEQRNVTKGQTQFTQQPLQSIEPGDRIDYELTINNNGYAMAYNVVVSDTLSLQYVSAEPYSVSEVNGSLTWNVGSMEVNDQKSLTVHCVVPSSYKIGTQAFNTFSCIFANSQGSNMMGKNFSNTVGVVVNVPTMNSYFTSSVIDTSSQVGVTYTKVQGTSVIVGQKLTYYIEVQIPSDTTVYNVVVTSTLIGNQEYTPNSFGGAGTIISASPQKIIVNFGDELSGGTKGLTLTSHYDITITQPSSPQYYPEGVMEENNVLTWDINNHGVNGVSAESYNYLISTSLILQLNFSQGLTVDSLSQNPITITNVGQEIYYQIQITNTSNSPMYNVEVYNNFQSNIKVQNITNIEFESVSGVIPAENFILVRPLGGSTIDGMMPVLNGGEVVIITLLCKILAPIVPGQTVQNKISSYYSTTIANLYGIQFGIINSNILEYNVDTNIVKINLVPIPGVVEVGNIVNYDLQIVIPVGLKLFNCVVEDIFPRGQEYLKDIQPPNMSVIHGNNNNQQVQLLQQAIINTETGGKILNYRYSAFINEPEELENLTSGSSLQLNQVFMKWGINATTPANLQVNANCAVNIISPYIFILAEQKVVGENDVFYEQKSEIVPYDYLNFKISIENMGQAIAYNLNINCKLDNLVKYVNPVQVNVGTISSDIGTNSVNWEIPILGVNEILSVTFKVQMQAGAPAAYITQNQVDGSFATTNIQNAVKYSVIGNVLEEQYPEIVVYKSASPISPTVGNKIKYTITAEVPANIDFYNLKVCDMLPLGQVYDSSIVPTVNGNVTTVTTNGQQICFEPIKNMSTSSSKTNFEFTFTAILQKKQEIDVNNTQNNLTYIGWFKNAGLTQPAVPQENNININIIDNLVVVNKYQRNYNSTNTFTQGAIYSSVNDVIEYKIKVTNNSSNIIDNIEVTDTLSPSLKLLQIKEISIGQIDLNLVKTGRIKWEGIVSLAPKSSIEVVYIAKILNFDNGNIIQNKAIENIINKAGSSVSNNIYSNIVKVKNLNTLFSFVPSKNNYMTRTKANSYGVLGCKGNINYILTNLSNATQDFILEIDAIPMNYNIFVNGVFVQEVYANTNFNSQIQALSKVGANKSVYITLEYKISKSSEIDDSIKFDITAIVVKTGNFITINSSIYLGKILMNLSYNYQEYLKNPNMYSINYEVIVTITKNIKVYDVQLEAFYPPSCILEGSRINGNIVQVSSIPGGIIYPVILEEGNTNQNSILIFNYTVLQYKNTPLAVGQLQQAGAILSIRTTKNIESKCIFRAYVGSDNTLEKFACLCIDNVFGKCAQYYKYDNVLLPQVTGYKFKNIIFGNPQINEGTLNISPSGCGHNFNKISYSFTVPYTIIYEIQGCSSVKTITKTGVLPRRNIESVVYVGDNVINESNIITGVEIQCTDYNTSYTEANVCLAIITYSVSKKGVLIKNEERQEVLKCCTNCNNTNNDKQLN